MVKIILENEGQIKKWHNSTGINIIKNEPFEIHWSFLKTKSEERKLFIKVRCDDCGIIYDRRIRDLKVDVNYHLCKKCVHKGERGPFYGKPINSGLKEACEKMNREGNNPFSRDSVKKIIKEKQKETIAKIVAKTTGQKRSEETKKQISISNTGQKRSQETIEKIKAKRKLQFGERNPGWKGGITPLVRLMRNNDNYSNWRKEVFKRDGFTCQMCEDKGIYLQGHHIIGVHEDLNLIYEISNGLTLCKKCHLDFHNKYGRKGFPNILLIINELKNEKK